MGADLPSPGSSGESYVPVEQGICSREGREGRGSVPLQLPASVRENPGLASGRGKLTGA